MSNEDRIRSAKWSIRNCNKMLDWERGWLAGQEARLQEARDAKDAALDAHAERFRTLPVRDDGAINAYNDRLRRITRQHDWAIAREETNCEHYAGLIAEHRADIERLNATIRELKGWPEVLAETVMNFSAVVVLFIGIYGGLCGGMKHGGDLFGIGAVLWLFLRLAVYMSEED